MVNGIDLFKEHFSDYKEQYTIIGGFACDLLMTDAGLDFRQTVDIDMVIIIEALTTEFASAFWTFIDDGGYQARHRSSGQPEFYRFVNPTDPSYPKMIELFSRPQSNVKLQPNTHLMPLHIDDEVSSLSAILLNDDYYHFLLNGRIEKAGISILDAEHIIPLKMKAWIDLKSKKEQGIHVPSSVLADIQNFILQMRETDIRLSDIGISRSKESILDIYSRMYIEEQMRKYIMNSFIPIFLFNKGKAVQIRRTGL